jgi:hypothetical protein
MTLTHAERRTLHHILATPPKPGETPDLEQLRTLLADHRHPWWLDLAPDGDETGHDGTTTVGGILAHSTTTEIESGADELHEVGSLHPTAAEALAVAAVNAAPWLLDRVAQLDERVHLHAATLAALRGLAADHQAPAEGGGLTDIEHIPPSTLLAILDAAPGLCPSTFVVPDDPTGRVRHCAGKPYHPGVMHGGDGAVWGDDAGVESHPGETLVLRMGMCYDLIRRQQADIEDAAARFRALIGRHRPVPARSDPAVELCTGCGKVWPCPDAVILGVDQATPEEIAAAMAGLGPRPGPAPDDVPAPTAPGGQS